MSRSQGRALHISLSPQFTQTTGVPLAGVRNLSPLPLPRWAPACPLPTKASGRRQQQAESSGWAVLASRTEGPAESNRQQGELGRCKIWGKRYAKSSHSQNSPASLWHMGTKAGCASEAQGTSSSTLALSSCLDAPSDVHLMRTEAVTVATPRSPQPHSPCALRLSPVQETRACGLDFCCAPQNELWMAWPRRG